MKSRSSLHISAIIAIAYSGISVFIGGCNTSPSAETATSDSTKGNSTVAKATPPPNLDIKSLQAQQSAADKAAAEMKKKFESGQK